MDTALRLQTLRYVFLAWGYNKQEGNNYKIPGIKSKYNMNFFLLASLKIVDVFPVKIIFQEN